ncbi:MAG TPA: glycosyltransferase family 4 protein [Stellaceae bacterium]|jgi:glycosyltransferase involved in cell wall biosynthesis|nr:glycosyltransferase family 4 protein [Stellaceae bacterium]
MAEPAPSRNAAIYYAADMFDTSRPRLMGRHSAGEGFLRGFVRHSGVDRLYCHSATETQAREFAGRAAACGGNVPIVWVPFNHPQGLAEPGCLFYQTVGIDQLAWRRRRLDQRAYSLVGITHTTASEAVMEVIAGLPIAPLQQWDALICTSRAVRNTVDQLIEAETAYLADRLGASRFHLPQLPIIPLGVDCDAFVPAPAVRAAWRRRLGIGDQDIAVLYVGRLSFHAKANPLPMYRGLQQARTAAPLPPGAALHLIQAGWFSNEAIERVFRDGAAAHCPGVTCHFIDGRDPEVRAGIWQAADIFTSLADNLQETFGLSPIEAMAAGLPVVVSDWDGYRDTVRHGIDGFLVPTVMPPAPYGLDLAERYAMATDNYDRYVGFSSQFIAVDTAAAAAAYGALIGNPELRRRMGAAGMAEARARLDWRVVIGRTQDLWSELADRRCHADEISPRRDDTIAAITLAHPARPDPFQAFSSYPTHALQPGSIVSLAPGASAAQLETRLASPLAEFAATVLPELADMAKVVHRLAADGPLTALAVVEAVKPANRASLYRGLCWMAKMDLLRIAMPAPPNTPI